MCKWEIGLAGPFAAKPAALLAAKQFAELGPFNLLLQKAVGPDELGQLIGPTFYSAALETINHFGPKLLGPIC